MDRSTDHDATEFYAEATDPERMREIVTRYLLTTADSPIEVIACNVAFARRGENRSLFQYDVTLRDPVGGETREHVVSGVTYSGQRTRRAWSRLEREQSLCPTEGAWLIRAAYVPELDLLLQTYPFDAQMPALEPLLAGPWPALVAQLLGQFGPGEWRLEEWQAETVRYRVDLRACVRLAIRAEEVGSGDTVERRFYAKVYANASMAALAWDVQEIMDAALAAGNAPFAIAPSVANLGEHQVLVQAEVAGTPLGHILQREDEAVAAARRAARAIAALHCLDVTAPAQRGAIERVGPDRVRRDADRLRAVRPDLGAAISVVEEGIIAALVATGEPPSVPVHGDLKPGHMLLDGDGVTLIDFDKFGAGDPLLDVTSMMANLRRRPFPEVAPAFIEEYLAHVPAAWERRLRPVYAAALLGEASGAVKGTQRGSNRRAQPADRAGSVLQEAQAVLAGGTW
ncbi:MAG: aminoglycoside phosphotransferase family protein [Chloroflexia bacterium]|nr:aminoglycoside phosphotransferase family protein [Chloroflexia bacterium]